MSESQRSTRHSNRPSATRFDPATHRRVPVTSDESSSRAPPSSSRGPLPAAALPPPPPPNPPLAGPSRSAVVVPDPRSSLLANRNVLASNGGGMASESDEDLPDLDAVVDESHKRRRSKEEKNKEKKRERKREKKKSKKRRSGNENNSLPGQIGAAIFQGAPLYPSRGSGSTVASSSSSFTTTTSSPSSGSSFAFNNVDSRGRLRATGLAPWFITVKKKQERNLIEVNFFPDPHDLTISISESCELAGHQISELTDAALSHVRGSLPILRGQLVNAVRNNINIYGIGGDHRLNRDLVRYWSTDFSFIFRSSTIKNAKRGKASRKFGAFENEHFRAMVAITCLDGHAGSRGVEELTVSAVAAVATMIQNAFDSYNTGRQLTVKFTEATYGPIYHSILDDLRNRQFSDSYGSLRAWLASFGPPAAIRRQRTLAPVGIPASDSEADSSSSESDSDSNSDSDSDSSSTSDGSVEDSHRKKRHLPSRDSPTDIDAPQASSEFASRFDSSVYTSAAYKRKGKTVVVGDSDSEDESEDAHSSESDGDSDEEEENEEEEDI